MRWLVNYFRQVFCEHEFKYEEQWATVKTDFGKYEGEVVYKRCEKCGYESIRKKWRV